MLHNRVCIEIATWCRKPRFALRIWWFQLWIGQISAGQSKALVKIFESFALWWTAGVQWGRCTDAQRWGPWGPLNDWRRSSRNVFYWRFHLPRWAWPVECKCWNRPMPTRSLRSFRNGRWTAQCASILMIILKRRLRKCRRLGLPQTSESIECRHGVFTFSRRIFVIFALIWSYGFLIWYKKVLDPICPPICCCSDVTYQDSIKRYGGPTAPSAPWPQDLMAVGKSDFKSEIFDHHSIAMKWTHFSNHCYN